MRWLLVFIVACLLFNVIGEWLHRIGLGRLPGDLHFRLGGREWFVPITSSVLLALLMALIGLVI